MAVSTRARQTDAEFAADLAERQARVEAGAAEIIARLHRPQTFFGRRRSETIVLALVAVPARETPSALFVSTDGDDSKAVAVPKSVLTIVQTEAEGLFILATMKAWVAADRHMAQANVPSLIRSNRWTLEQRDAWKRLQARITGVRRYLDDERRKANGLRVPKRNFALRRSETA